MIEENPVRTKIFAVVNPAANNGRAGRNWPDIRRRLEERGFDISQELTRYPGHASRLAGRALENGYDTVLAVGGDGTFSEVAEAFYQKQNSEDNFTERSMRIYPLGSGCDLALYFNLKPGQALSSKYPVRGSRKEIDLIELSFSGGGSNNNRLTAVNIVDLGAVAHSLQKVHDGGRNKSKFSYVSTALLAALKFSPFSARISVDGRQVWQGDILDVFLANGPTMAGGFPLCPPARVEDGQLDLVILPAIGRFKLMRAFFRAWRGQHLKLPYIEHYQGREVMISTENGIPVEVDGDYLGDLAAGEINFKLKPGALNMRV